MDFLQYFPRLLPSTAIFSLASIQSYWSLHLEWQLDVLSNSWPSSSLDSEASSSYVFWSSLPRNCQLAYQSVGASCSDSSSSWSPISKLDDGLWRGKPQEIDVELRLQNLTKKLRSFQIGHLSRKLRTPHLHYCTTIRASAHYWPQLRRA